MLDRYKVEALKARSTVVKANLGLPQTLNPKP